MWLLTITPTGNSRALNRFYTISDRIWRGIPITPMLYGLCSRFLNLNDNSLTTCSECYRNCCFFDVNLYCFDPFNWLCLKLNGIAVWQFLYFILKFLYSDFIDLFVCLFLVLFDLFQLFIDIFDWLFQLVYWFFCKLRGNARIARLISRFDNLMDVENSW